MKVETGQYYTVERRKEVADSARKLRRQFLRYKEAEIVYSIQHKKLLELAGKAGALVRIDGYVLIDRDISSDEVVNKWSDFIYSHHYRHTDNFFSSYLGMFLRRSCEMVFATVQLNMAPDVERGFHAGMSWEEVLDFVSSLLQEEMDTPKDKNLPLHYLKAGQFNR